MSTAREDILARIRAAGAHRPDASAVPRDYRQAGEPVAHPVEPSNPSDPADPMHPMDTMEPANPADPADPLVERLDLVDLLVERLVDYRARVLRADPGTAAQVIGTEVRRHRAERIVVPDGFPPELLARLDAEVVRDDPPLSAADLDTLNGALTLSRVAVAETGTIVLDAGPGQGRRALTLVPDYHLCVVRDRDVVRGVPEVIARLESSHDRPLTWISGPSATSDIELERVEGVHGPRTLVVVLISNPDR
jgi:L-lactate dehydrogenase complex protein LldG